MTSCTVGIQRTDVLVLNIFNCHFLPGHRAVQFLISGFLGAVPLHRQHQQKLAEREEVGEVERGRAGDRGEGGVLHGREATHGRHICCSINFLLFGT